MLRTVRPIGCAIAFLFLYSGDAGFARAQALPPTPAAAKGDAPSPSPQSVEPGYLGLVTDDRQDAEKGVRVTEAVGDSPAAKGGFAAGDLIVGIDGKTVHDNADMGAVIGALPPGSQVVFDIDRNGQKQQLNVTLGKRPAATERRYEQFGPVEETLPAPSNGGPTPSAATPLLPTPSGSSGSPAASGPVTAGGPRPVPRANAPSIPHLADARRPLLGVHTQPITEDVRTRLHLPSASGAWVVSRTTGLPAEKAGIPLDAVIVAINGTAVDSPADLSRLVSQLGTHAQAEVTYIANGATHQATVVLGEGSIANSITPPNLPLPIAPTPSSYRGTAPNDDRAEIDALKRRVQELEQRVQQLEQAVKK